MIIKHRRTHANDTKELPYAFRNSSRLADIGLGMPSLLIKINARLVLKQMLGTIKKVLVSYNQKTFGTFQMVFGRSHFHVSIRFKELVPALFAITLSVPDQGMAQLEPLLTIASHVIQAFKL